MPPTSRRQLSPLGIALSRLLEAREMTYADFARKSGLSKAMVSMMKHQRVRKLPSKVNVAHWTKVLGLTDREANVLLEATLLTWSPEGMIELLDKIKRR